MDEESIKAAKLLAAIAESNYGIFRFAEAAKKTNRVEGISHDFECSRNSNYFDYGTGSPYLFDWYVEMNVIDGRVITLIIELLWDDQKWLVQSRLETPGESGSIPLVDFPERGAETVEDLIELLKTATTELIEAGADQL
jgi:hypothetical protein